MQSYWVLRCAFCVRVNSCLFEKVCLKASFVWRTVQFKNKKELCWYNLNNCNGFSMYINGCISSAALWIHSPRFHIVHTLFLPCISKNGESIFGQQDELTPSNKVMQTTNDCRALWTETFHCGYVEHRHSSMYVCSTHSIKLYSLFCSESFPLHMHVLVSFGNNGEYR